MPQHSGFIASLVSGDYVFVAGQMPNNDAMTAIEPSAYRAPNAVWNGTDIRLPAAVVAGDLVCLSALYAADENGVLATSQSSVGLRHLGVPMRHQ